MYLNFFQSNIIIDLNKIVAFKCYDWDENHPVIRFYTSFDDNGYQDIYFETKELRDKQYGEIVFILMRYNCLSIRQNEND